MLKVKKYVNPNVSVALHLRETCSLLVGLYAIPPAGRPPRSHTCHPVCKRKRKKR